MYKFVATNEKEELGHSHSNAPWQKSAVARYSRC